MKPSRNAAHLRYAQYYQHLAHSLDQLLLKGGAEMIRSLASYDQEWLNILTGFKWAANTFEQNQAIGELCSAYAESGIHCLEIHQPAAVQLDWFTNGLKVARALSHPI